MCDNSRKLAVLMPVFNGGDYLRRSLMSCANGGLDGTQYEIIVVDNCSRDGSTRYLPAHDAKGASVQLHRNIENIGRVANWNRSVEIALDQGFRYVTFLFAGDCWIPDGSLPELLYLLREYDGAVAFSPFRITDEDGNEKRSSQRFYVPDGAAAVISPRRFLSSLLRSGLFPLGPLQANVYRISPGDCIRFDDGAPTVTDVSATLEFVAGATRDVVVVSKPFLEWREHPARFHASMGTARTIQDYFDTFHTACRTTSIPVDYGRAKTGVVLNALRLIVSDASPREWPALIRDLARCARLSPYRSSIGNFVELFWRRLALRRHLIEVA